ncbi:MAG: hypothetical protein ACRD3W_28790 [Terriglobales bacterium]
MEEAAPEGAAEDVLNGCYDEAAEFIRAIAGKDAPRPSIEEVFPSVELCLAMTRNAAEDAGKLAAAKI